MAAGAVVWCVAFPFTFGPSFRAMFADFGGALPAVTVLALSPWFGPVVSVVPALLLAVAVGTRLRIGARRGLIVASFALGAIGAALLVWGVYLPVFALAALVGRSGAQ